MTPDIVPLDFGASPELAAGYHRVAGHLHAPGPPMSPHLFRLWVERGWRSVPSETFLALDDGRVIGGVTLHLFDRDRLGDVLIRVLEVAPGWRGRGVGSALLGVARERARALGRSKLVVEAKDDGFLARHGFRAVYTEARRVLHRSRHAGPLPGPPGYTFETTVGPTPPGRLAEMVPLLDAMNDAPTDDHEVDAERWTTGLIRGYEDTWEPARQTVYTTVARAADGEAAAFTRIFVDADEPGGWARQTDTAVLKGHRGQNLGYHVKLCNTARMFAAEPAVERVITWNAVSNRHMIAINERLGYELLDVWHVWELRT
ncbi:GNAT family N-acetyltransferase [Herbidospora yilanensis]|uniref:GNAT family N-acetyltransferase n=1 Tax=Herbidospora yilanensis TaxID=354426 RepID=UPI0007862DB3|nr:GNAT family N-acetyltransferase [Herbidospora yilanensis]